MFDNIFGDNTAQNNVNQAQSVVSTPVPPVPTQPDPVSQPPAPAPSPQIPPSPPPFQVPVEPSVSPTLQDMTQAPPPPQQEDTSVITFDEAYKDKIGMQLTEAMLKAVEEKKLTEGEMGVISGYILDNIDNIRSHDDLMVFLQGLSQRFKVFKQIFKVEKGVDKESKEDDRAAEIAGLIKENKIDEALTTAQNATGGVS